MANTLENNAYIQLFKHVELRVEKNGEQTTLVDICFQKTEHFFHFHKICAATTIQMRISMGLSTDTDADETMPNAVDESKSAQKVTAETQIAILAQSNRESTAKRRNTEMDLSDLETNKRKSMRSNDRTIVQSVEVFRGAALWNRNVAGSTVISIDGRSISESSSTQNDEDAHSASESNETNEAIEAAAQPPPGTFTSDVNRMPSDTSVTNAQSSRMENDLHTEAAEEFNVVPENTINGSILTDRNFLLRRNRRATSIQRQTDVGLNLTKRKTIRPRVRSTIHSIAIHSCPALEHQKVGKCSTNNDCSETGTSSSLCAEDKQVESDDNGKRYESACCVPDLAGSNDTEQQTTVAADRTGDSKHCNSQVDTSVWATLLIEREAQAPIGNVIGVADCKVRIKKLRAKNKKNVKVKMFENIERFHINCKAPRRGGCQELFESTEAMMYHVISYHAKRIKRKFSCHLCGKTTTVRSNLRHHMDAVHVGLKRFKCAFPNCSKAFALKNDLQRHTNAIHTKKIAFKCTQCREKFFYKQLLTRHLANKHGIGITYSCYLCKKSLGDKQSLQLHMNSKHTGQSRLKCPFPKCSKAFAQKGALQQHTNAIHTKKNAFKCTKCREKFYRKAYLTRHLANRHGKGIAYSCYLCKKSLGGKRQLQLHMNLLHTGQSLFHCPVCFRGFETKCNMERHLNFSKFFDCSGKNRQSISRRTLPNANE